MNLQSCAKVLLILLTSSGFANAQVVDSLINTIPPSKYYFIGQAHNNKANLQLEQELLFALNRKYGLRYDILEYGHSAAIIVNEFLRTGEDSLLKLIHPGTAFTFFRTIKKFNDTIPEKRKILFYGIDFEGRDNYKHLKIAIDIVLRNTMLQDTTTLYRILKRIRNGKKEMRELGFHLDHHESESRKLLGKYFIDLLLVANAQNGFSRNRDFPMYANFKKLYNELKLTDTNLMFLSSFGYSHIHPSNSQAIANRLGNEYGSPVRGSVALIAIQYYQSSFQQEEVKKWAGNLSFLCNTNALQGLATDKPGIYFISPSRLASLSCNSDVKKLAALILVSNMSSTKNYIWE